MAAGSEDDPGRALTFEPPPKMVEAEERGRASQPTSQSASSDLPEAVSSSATVNDQAGHGKKATEGGAVEEDRSRRRDESNDEEEEPEPSGATGRYYKHWPRVPFFRRPLREGDGEWVREKHKASTWVSLFYDLSVAAVLSTFSSTHELGTPHVIPGYIAYFVIIHWMWSTQVQYDVRYQSEDLAHRIYKAIQITLFVYIGASSQNWDLSKLRQGSEDMTDRERSTREYALESFVTVATAFAISRAELATEYSICWDLGAFLGRRSGRQVRLQLSTACVLVVSAILGIVAAALPTRSTGTVIVKIGLIYLGIALEGVVHIFHLCKSLRQPLSVETIGHRYGCLTLIILGEGGFISLTSSLNYALSGLSDRNRATYGQAFLAIGIILMVYLFIFAWFRPEEEVTGKRAFAWEAIHLPLHLAILLLFAAMITSYSVVEGAPLPTERQAEIDRYLNRLYLQPSWDDMFQRLGEIADDPVPSLDAFILSTQYFGQVIIETTGTYGIPIAEATYDTYIDLSRVNASYTTNTTERTLRQLQATRLVGEVIGAPINDTFSGTLWLFPCAGAVLILAAFRSITWYRLEGIDNWLVHGLMVVFGVVLGLLGLLSVGNTTIGVVSADGDAAQGQDLAPIYDLTLASKTPLLIVFLVYVLVYFGAASVLVVRRLNWRQRAQHVGNRSDPGLGKRKPH